MIPYFPQPVFVIGRLTIYAFSIMLIVAIVVGRSAILRRAWRLGVDVEGMSRLCVWILLSGMFCAHATKTILSDIPAFFADPLEIVRLKGGIASLGGLGGGLVGAIVWCRLHRLSGFETLRRMDIIAFCLPGAWIFGRLGCSLAHDHPGIPTTSWIGVQFPQGTRYDLGIIEFLFLIAFTAVFCWLDRQPRPVGFFFGMYGVVYGAFRIWLDTLHIQPLRFLGGAAACLIGLAGWAAMWWFEKTRASAATRQAPAQSLRPAME